MRHLTLKRFAGGVLLFWLAVFALLFASAATAQQPGSVYRAPLRQVRVDSANATTVFYHVIESEATPSTVCTPTRCPRYSAGVASFLTNFVFVSAAPVPPPPDTTRPIPDPLPPPPGRQIVFASDFSTAQGTSTAAVTDGGRWNVSSTTPETMRIVSSAGLDFPTANVMEMIATSARQGFAIIRKTGMPVPAVGESRFYRWYIRIMQPDGLSDAQTHPIQDGNSASVSNWMSIVYNSGSGIPPGQWQPQFWLEGEGGNSARWYAPILNKRQTYRFELQIARTGATTFQMHIRIYNSAGTLIADDGNIQNINNAARLSSNPTLTFHNVANLDGLNAGNNGISSLPAGSNFTYAYQGGFAVCAGTWCGPYVAGER